ASRYAVFFGVGEIISSCTKSSELSDIFFCKYNNILMDSEIKNSETKQTENIEKEDNSEIKTKSKKKKTKENVEKDKNDSDSDKESDNEVKITKKETKKNIKVNDDIELEVKRSKPKNNAR